MSEKFVFTIKEIAEQLGVSVPTASHLVESEGFPVLRIGRRKVIPVAEFRDWVARSSVRGDRT